MKDSIFAWTLPLKKASDQALSLLPKELQGTLKVRAFGLLRVPLLFLTSPKVLRLDQESCELEIPFRKIVKNHLGSLYFGVFAIGADACVGLAAFDEIEKSGQPISLIFQSFRADFLKRAEGPTRFVFSKKNQMREFVKQVAQSNERMSQAFECIALVDNEMVAKFELTLSLKKTR